jgi:hypothetical protein
MASYDATLETINDFVFIIAPEKLGCKEGFMFKVICNWPGYNPI